MKRITSFMFIAATMLLSCQNKSRQSECFKDMPQFELRFPQKTLVVRHPYTKENCDSVITYSSMEEAEWKLVHYFFPDGIDIQNMEFDYANFDYGLFEKLIKSDTSSMTYPFDSLQHYAKIFILDSPDCNVRYYTWDNPHRHTMSDYRTYTQYRYKNEIHFQEPVGTSQNEDCWFEETLSPICLYVLDSDEGVRYLTARDMKEYSSQAYTKFNIYKLTKDGLQEVAFKKSDGEDSMYVSYEYNIPDWYFKTNNGEGYQWLNYFDENNSILYVAEDELYLTDRYWCYKWNGHYMELVEKKTFANPFLHISLNDYESLEFLKLSKRNLIRVDKIKDGIYRYAAWAADKKMDSEPELVITNGTRDEKTKQFIFKNKEYECRVSEYNLYVLKDGKQIAKYDFED